MIFSASKARDMRIRDNLLDIMESLAKMYKRTNEQKYLDDMKEIGKESARIKERIETFGYCQEDAEQEIADSLQHRFNSIMNGKV